jgi:hypothetical protein
LNKSITIKFLLISAFTSIIACAEVKHNQIALKPTSIKADSSFRFVKLIAGNYSMLDVDALGNIYCINENDQLKKLNSNGDSVAVFNEVKKYGKVSKIDVSNPLKILLYYENYSTVVVLDRFLSYRTSINFRKENIFKVHAIATSYDNNIWIFDEQDFKLKKISDKGEPISETTDWRQIFDEAPTPNTIIDKENYVYLYDEQKGFYIFDYYGSFKNNLPFLNWKHVAVAANLLYGFSSDSLYQYNIKLHNLKSYELPLFFNKYKNIIALNAKVYVLKKEGIEIYEIL